MLKKLKLLAIKARSFVIKGKVNKGNDGGYTWVGSSEQKPEIKANNDSKPETPN